MKFMRALPIGVTEEALGRCKNIVAALTGKQDTTELALIILQLVYSKGGDYSEKTILTFAETYINNLR